VIIRRDANATKAENQIATGEAAIEGIDHALPVVAQIQCPVKSQPARGEDCNQLRQVLILPRAENDFVADDEGADGMGYIGLNRHSCTPCCRRN
jgi:hypothetical protein